MSIRFEVNILCLMVRHMYDLHNLCNRNFGLIKLKKLNVKRTLVGQVSHFGPVLGHYGPVNPN